LPNFGNILTGTNGDLAGLANASVLRKCTLLEYGTLTYVMGYMDCGVCSGIGVVYAADGVGGIPGTLLGQSAEVLLTPEDYAWNVFPFDLPLVGSDYWLGVLFSSNQSRLWSIKEASSSGYAGDTYADGPENPLVGFTATPLYNPCLYGVYTVDRVKPVVVSPPYGPHQFQRRAGTPPVKRIKTV
jgi:hypothetical protein